MENQQGSRNRVYQAAGFIMFTTVISKVLGYLRDVFIYNQFGQNRITDVYNAAFTIPDLLYTILVGGALCSAFVPIFTSYIATNKKEEGWQVASIVFNWVMVLLVVGIGLGCIFTPQLVRLIVPGFEADAMDMVVNLTRLMFLQALFMSLSGISMGILNSFKQFTLPALGGVIYNLGIILGGLFLAGPIEKIWPGYGIAGYSVGVVLGAALNFAIQVPGLRKLGMKYTRSFNLKNPGVQRLLLLMVPVLIGLSVSQINLLVNQSLASHLTDGAVAALRTAQRIMYIPIGVFAISIAMAFYPTLTTYAANGHIEDYKQSMAFGIRSVIYICMPAAVGLAVLREPIIRFMFEFQGGKFTPESTSATAYALLFYSIGIFAYGAIHVITRAFYSLQDTVTPVLAGVATILVNVILSFYLVDKMAQGGLALAYSLAGIYNLFILMALMRQKVGPYGGRQMLFSFLQTCFASVVMGCVAYMMACISAQIFGDASKFSQLLQLALSIVSAVVVYLMVTEKMLFMPEAKQVTGVIMRRFQKKKKDLADAEE